MQDDQKTKVLLVDDDHFLLDMYSLKFGRGGLDVVAAAGAAEALKKLKDGFHPDIMVLDVVMPGMDGIELLETIRKENLAPDAVVVMLTNQGQSSDIERAKKVGVHGYIVKASTIPSEVLQEIRSIYETNRKKGKKGGGEAAAGEEKAEGK